MDEYIDREIAELAIMEAELECTGHEIAFEKVKEKLKTVQSESDVVKVVHCKDCKYSDYKESVIGCVCFKRLENVGGNNFCSKGVRR